ncbi:hypothetical protein Tco_0910274 [Tanacetum coccineum]|uniref:Retrovirus-related Pol polyprotein from transposon TNT 1-94 n=1 Tax=Tanacetum coccineum TaxID=301880 RepID=A0ABQ5CYR2_9ASTR
MLMKPQFFYDHTTNQNPFYLKKAQQLEPKLYDGNVIKNTSAIVIPDSKETLILAEENFEKRFVPQTELFAEQAFWSQNSVNSPEPTLSSRPTKVEVPKELPKVSMVNTRVKPSTSASGSQPSSNTKKDKILQTPSSTQKNKVEAHPMKVKSSLKNKDCVVKPKETAHVQHSQLNANSELKCDKKSKTNVSVSKSKVLKSVSANKKEPSQSWGSIVSDVPSSSLDECRQKQEETPQNLKSEDRSSNQGKTLSFAPWLFCGPCVVASVNGKKSVAYECYTQNRSIVRLHHGKTPYELLHDKLPDLSFFHVFGALCYPTNDSGELGKLQHEGYLLVFSLAMQPTKKAFRFRMTYQTVLSKTIRRFDELTAIASEHSSSGPALHEMTPAIISS